MTDLAIQCSGLERRFNDFIAVDCIDLQVRPGEIFGFLGANGAGKSTTIRMLCGLLEPSSGSATVAGYDVKSQPDMVKQHIGYMSQKFSLYEDLTVSENIDFYAGVYGIDDSTAKNRKDWAIRTADLTGLEDRLAGSLPLGWKQRLALGCSMLHSPRIVFLDEPTSGVDPVSRRRFWDLINEISESGVTVFVTTHYLDEAEYCNNIALIHSGSIIASGSPDKLKAEVIRRPILEIDCNNPQEAEIALRDCDLVTDVLFFGSMLHATASETFRNSKEIVAFLGQKGIYGIQVQQISPSLEDVFIRLIESQSTNPS